MTHILYRKALNKWEGKIHYQGTNTSTFTLEPEEYVFVFKVKYDEKEFEEKVSVEELYNRLAKGRLKKQLLKYDKERGVNYKKTRVKRFECPECKGVLSEIGNVYTCDCGLKLVRQEN